MFFTSGFLTVFSRAIGGFLAVFFLDTGGFPKVFLESKAPL
jgi:hypothetical protein